MSEPASEFTSAQRDETPLHRPRPCSACGQESRAILNGQCLACRLPGDPDAAIRTGREVRAS